MLDVRLEKDALLFSGFDGDGASLPEATYGFTMHVESMRCKGDSQRLVPRQGRVTEMVLEEKPDKRKVTLIEPFDKLTAAVVEEPRTRLNGEGAAISWLRSSRPRPARVGVSAGDAGRGARNRMQLCAAIPPATMASDRVCVDADIGLGNPLWDLEGLIIHIGELIDPSRKDHLALRDKLAGTASDEFLYYE